MSKKISRASEIAMELVDKHLPSWDEERPARYFLGKISNASRMQIVLALGNLEKRELVVSRPGPDGDTRLYRPKWLVVDDPDPIQEFLNARLGINPATLKSKTIRHSMDERRKVHHGIRQ